MIYFLNSMEIAISGFTTLLNSLIVIFIYYK